MLELSRTIWQTIIWQTIRPNHLARKYRKTVNLLAPRTTGAMALEGPTDAKARAGLHEGNDNKAV